MPSVIVEPPSKVSIMAVAAHPDDVESWCAGTLACAIDAGASVRLLLVTSGDKGSSDPAANPRAVAALREGESREAARRLWLDEVAFRRHPDGEVEDTRLPVSVVRPLRRRYAPRLASSMPPSGASPSSPDPAVPAGTCSRTSPTPSHSERSTTSP